MGAARHNVIMAEMLLASCIFVVGLIYSISQSVPYRRSLHQLVVQSVADQRENEIHLEVDENGLVETIGEVRSFAPWEAVRGYRHVDGRLFVELASGSWAIIPERELRGEGDGFASLLSQLKERQVRNQMDGGDEG